LTVAIALQGWALHSIVDIKERVARLEGRTISSRMTRIQDCAQFGDSRIVQLCRIHYERNDDVKTIHRMIKTGTVVQHYEGPTLRATIPVANEADYRENSDFDLPPTETTDAPQATTGKKRRA
jgi:hypothetical protein